MKTISGTSAEPLVCDCYGGCWGNHVRVQGWHRLTAESDSEAAALQRAAVAEGLRSGSFVMDGDELWLCSYEDLKRVRRRLRRQSGAAQADDPSPEPPPAPLSPDLADHLLHPKLRRIIEDLKTASPYTLDTMIGSSGFMLSDLLTEWQSDGAPIMFDPHRNEID